MGFWKLFFETLKPSAAAAGPVRQVPACPRCRRDLAPHAAGPWLCGACGGMWASSDVVERSLDADEPMGEGGLGSHTFSSSSAPCPVCDAEMENYQFAGDSGFYLDACPSGHGIWMDPGELRMMREHRARLRGPMSASEKVAFGEGMSRVLRDEAARPRAPLPPDFWADVPSVAEAQAWAGDVFGDVSGG